MVDIKNGSLITDIILQIFQLNGKLLEFGDRITLETALTTSRWQVMGVIFEVSHTVSEIARIRGIQRQSVQRTVNLLLKEKLVVLEENPHHKMAKLVSLTDAGKVKYTQVMDKYVPIANSIAKDFKPELLEALKNGLQQFLELEI